MRWPKLRRVVLTDILQLRWCASSIALQRKEARSGGRRWDIAGQVRPWGNEVLGLERWNYGTVPRTAHAVAVKDRAPSAAPEQ